VPRSVCGERRKGERGLFPDRGQTTLDFWEREASGFVEKHGYCGEGKRGRQLEGLTRVPAGEKREAGLDSAHPPIAMGRGGGVQSGILGKGVPVIGALNGKEKVSLSRRQGGVPHL